MALSPQRSGGSLAFCSHPRVSQKDGQAFVCFPFAFLRPERPTFRDPVLGHPLLVVFCPLSTLFQPAFCLGNQFPWTIARASFHFRLGLGLANGRHCERTRRERGSRGEALLVPRCAPPHFPVLLTCCSYGCGWVTPLPPTGFPHKVPSPYLPQRRGTKELSASC